MNGNSLRETWKEKDLERSMKRHSRESSIDRRERSKSKNRENVKLSKSQIQEDPKNKNLIQKPSNSKKPISKLNDSSAKTSHRSDSSVDRNKVKNSKVKQSNSKKSISKSNESNAYAFHHGNSSVDKNEVKNSKVSTSQRTKTLNDVATRKSTQSKKTNTSIEKNGRIPTQKVKTSISHRTDLTKDHRHKSSKKDESSLTYGRNSSNKASSDLKIKNVLHSTSKSKSSEKDQKKRDGSTKRKGSTSNHHQSAQRDKERKKYPNDEDGAGKPHRSKKHSGIKISKNSLPEMLSKVDVKDEPSDTVKSLNQADSFKNVDEMLEDVKAEEIEVKDEPSDTVKSLNQADSINNVDETYENVKTEEIGESDDEQDVVNSFPQDLSDNDSGEDYNYEGEEFEDYDSDFEEESVESGAEESINGQNELKNNDNEDMADDNETSDDSDQSVANSDIQSDNQPVKNGSENIVNNSHVSDVATNFNGVKADENVDHSNQSTPKKSDVESPQEDDHYNESFITQPSPKHTKFVIDFTKTKTEDATQQNNNVTMKSDVKPKKIISFINSDKKEMQKESSNKIRRRADEILELVTLDTNYYELFDLPPVNYEMYIKSYGRMNSKQVCVQTDNKMDDECQTEEIESCEKWTQCPAHDYKGYGGDIILDDQAGLSSWEFQTKTDILKLNNFLQSVEQVITTLLQEGRSELYIKKLENNQANISFSDGFFQLTPPPFRKGCAVTYVQFSSNQENMLISVHGTPPESSDIQTLDEKGIICVWNLYSPATPDKILMCSSQPLCACFSPVKANMVFAGMVDGSVSVWDLGESVAKHKHFKTGEQSWVIRTASYSTAEILKDDGHLGAVVSIQTIMYTNERASSSRKDSTDQAGSASFEVASLEENGVIKFWLVVEENQEELAGSVTDLGLAPNGKVKLVLSSTVNLQESSGLDDVLMSGMKVHDIQFNPFNPNHMYVATDAGSVIHYSKHGSTPIPKLYVSNSGLLCDIQTIDFSPHHLPYLLVGCSNGSVILYCIRSANPLMTWSNVTGGLPVLKIKWSKSQPSIFYVLDISSRIHVWDLSHDSTGPFESCHFLQGRIMSFDLNTVFGHNTTSKPVIALAMDDSSIEIHQISKKFSTVPEERFHELSVSVTSL